MNGARDRGLRVGFSPLAGVTAGSMAVVFAFGVLLLAWHQVAGHVSLAITMLAYAVIVALAVVTGAGTWLVVLWVAHRHRHPELLAGRRPVVAQVISEPAEPSIVNQGAVPVQYAQPSAAIESPRVYLNVTDDQLEAIMRHSAGRNDDD